MDRASRLEFLRKEYEQYKQKLEEARAISFHSEMSSIRKVIRKIVSEIKQLEG